MHLYNLTLQAPTAITAAVLGNFSGVRQQEIAVSRGTRLELLRPDPNTGKVSSVLTQDIFGVIRSLASFRLTGGTKGVWNVRCSGEMLIELFEHRRLYHHRFGLWTHSYC